MQESDFWGHLEYRVCREIAGFPSKLARRFWCDGIAPDLYRLDGPEPRILGHAWMAVGAGRQERWEFTLLLAEPASGTDAIDWAKLLPPAEATRWLTLDVGRKRLVMEPGIAVPDAGPRAGRG